MGKSNISKNNTTVSTGKTTSQPVITGSQAAYVQLNEELKKIRSREYQNPYDQALLDMTQGKTDEEYAAGAKAAKLPAYEAEKEALRQAQEQANLQYQNDRETLLAQNQADRRQINEDYALRQGELATAANRRGMGRSSHYLDSAAYLGAQQNQALSEADQNTQTAVRQLDAAQALALEHYSQTLARLETDLALTLAEYEDSLRQKDKSAAQAAYKQLADHYDAYLRYKDEDTLKLITAISSLSTKETKAMTESQYQSVLNQLAAFAG